MDKRQLNKLIKECLGEIIDEINIGSANVDTSEIGGPHEFEVGDIVKVKIVRGGKIGIFTGKIEELQIPNNIFTPILKKIVLKRAFGLDYDPNERWYKISSLDHPEDDYFIPYRALTLLKPKANEGYGYGDPSKDRLRKGKMRWTLKWYNAGKTPKMNEDAVPSNDPGGRLYKDDYHEPPPENDPAKVERGMLINIKNQLVKDFGWKTVHEEKSFNTLPISFILEKTIDKVTIRLELEMEQRIGINFDYLLGAKPGVANTNPNSKQKSFIKFIHAHEWGTIEIDKYNQNSARELNSNIDKLLQKWINNDVFKSYVNQVITTGKGSKPPKLKEDEESDKEDFEDFFNMDDPDSTLKPGHTNFPTGHGYPNVDRNIQKRLHLDYVSDTNADSNDPKNYPLFVSAYDHVRAYGGPEEGGWWYDVYTLQGSVEVNNKEESYEIGVKLFKQYVHEADGQIEIFLEKEKGAYDNSNNPPPQYS